MPGDCFAHCIIDMRLGKIARNDTIGMTYKTANNFPSYVEIVP